MIVQNTPNGAILDAVSAAAIKKLCSDPILTENDVATIMRLNVVRVRDVTKGEMYKNIPPMSDQRLMEYFIPVEGAKS